MRRGERKGYYIPARNVATRGFKGCERLPLYFWISVPQRKTIESLTKSNVYFTKSVDLIVGTYPLELNARNVIVINSTLNYQKFTFSTSNKHEYKE